MSLLIELLGELIKRALRGALIVTLLGGLGGVAGEARASETVCMDKKVAKGTARVLTALGDALRNALDRADACARRPDRGGEDTDCLLAFSETLLLQKIADAIDEKKKTKPPEGE